jgi:hypothetical protein
MLSNWEIEKRKKKKPNFDFFGLPAFFYTGKNFCDFWLGLKIKKGFYPPLTWGYERQSVLIFFFFW